MLTCKTIEVRRSKIHGNGLFATADIPRGTTLWEYGPCDSKMRPHCASKRQLHFGYISNVDGLLVICGDDARWWNFGFKPNCGESRRFKGGEPTIVSKARIRAGNELLIDLASDADAKRKLLL